MNPEHNLLDLLDPRKTTSPITSLPKLSADTCRAFSAKSKAPTCSTKSSESPENNFLTIMQKESERQAKEKASSHSKPRNGDWICLICGNHNYSFRESCNRCQKQTKACNLQQSLQIYDNPALRNDLMKNETMAKRLEFNFCYSLSSEKLGEKTRNTLNTNIVSGMGFQMPVPFAMVNRPVQFPPMSEYFFAPKTPFQNMKNIPTNSTDQGNFMFPQSRVQHSQSQFPVHSDFSSKFSKLPQVSEISPMLNYSENQRVRDFRKGTIKSDICHDKSFSQVDLHSTPLQNMQQNLVEKFRQMKLIPSEKNVENGKNNQKKPFLGAFKNKQKKKSKQKTKENLNPKGEAKKKMKSKRRGKLKYKAVKLTQNKKKEGNKQSTVNSHKIENKVTVEVNPTKSVEELFRTQFSLKKVEGVREEKRERKAFGDFQESPKKINFGSIFHSKLLFDFETPKKARNDCFLNENSLAKDSDFKLTSGFSKQKNKILRLFSQSDDEEMEEEFKRNEYFESLIDEKEFSHSIEQMKKSGFGPNERVF